MRQQEKKMKIEEILKRRNGELYSIVHKAQDLKSVGKHHRDQIVDELTLELGDRGTANGEINEYGQMIDDLIGTFTQWLED